MIVPEFPPDTIGGGGPVFEMLAKTLAERGHDVRVLTARTYGAPIADDAGYPFPVLRVPELRHFTSQFKTYMPPSPFGLRGVRAFLRGSDAYHLHGYGMPFIDAAFNVLVPPRRAAFTTHGFPYTVRARGGWLAALYRVYDSAIGSRVLKRSARVTAVSSLLAQQARAVSGRDVVVIPNGFVPLPRGAQLDPALEREMAKGPYVLGVGRLEELKGFDTAVEALALLSARNPELRLLLAGADNGAQRSLRALAERLNLSSAVSFLGAIERAQLAHLYERAACCAVTSRTESFSLVTLEAMASGTPCAASAVGGILDIARDEENALLFPPGDAAALADRVERILHSPESRERLRAGGRATLGRFSWEHVAAQYESVYASL